MQLGQYASFFHDHQENSPTFSAPKLIPTFPVSGNPAYSLLYGRNIWGN